jgi:ubiquinone/menaquinone biosynthesis C-methylase UbiE
MKITAIGVIIFVLFSFGKCNSSKPARKPFINPQYNYTYKPRSTDGTGKFYANREIAQVMGAEGTAWLDRKDREKEENSNLAIDKMNLTPTSIVADIGAGTGYYTFKIARGVPQGKVYAVEIQDELINYLNNEKKELGASNVEVIKGDSKSPHLPDSSIDLAILIDVYHELEYPKEMMHYITKALKSNGKILLLEYRAEDPKIPVLPLHKMSIEQTNKEMAANGFKLSADGEFLPLQHFLLYQKINP